MLKFLLLAVCIAITVWLSLNYIGRLIRGFEIPNALMLSHGAAEAALLHSGRVFRCIREAYVQRDLRGMASRSGLPQCLQSAPRLQVQSG